MVVTLGSLLQVDSDFVSISLQSGHFCCTTNNNNIKSYITNMEV